MTKLIVITGITGKQGGSVADAFLSAPGWRIRAITRNPSSPAATAWAAKGVELVQADMDSIPSLTTAFAGATAIFAMTDFWTPMADPATHAAAAARGVSVNEQCHDLEVRRGKNLAIAAGATAGLERFVWSTLSAAAARSGGRYRQLWHFDGKAEVERFARAELPGKARFVQVGLYVDNWRVAAQEIVRGPDGRFVHRGLGDGRTRLPFVWTRRDVGVVVRRLVEEVEAGKSALAYSEFISWREFMAKFSKVLGVELGGDEGIETLSFQELKDVTHGDENIKNEVAESFAYFEEFGYDGGDPEVLYAKDIGVESLLTPIEEYIKQEDWSSIMNVD
ncbi:NAD(P)-binding protein [Neofusicoccum parvum]|uniref:NAD(P)-binding protein n=1 Tax=Neofusicoccum parvum TaxID=310453 RepID=A0ACB5SPQ1_9PEZI|nr:NAD(P)-binding protein [Neofusicoccum parvum]